MSPREENPLAGLIDAFRCEELLADGQASRERLDEFRSSLVCWDEFWSAEREEAEWAHEPVLARGRGHSIYARHKVGKSLLALYFAKEIVARGETVLYLDHEQGADDLYERLADMGCGPETDLSRLRYALLPSMPPLDTAEGGITLAAVLDDTLAALGGPLTVIIDTFSRVTSGDENSNDTVRAFYRYSGIELKRRGVTWARLDHGGWDDSNGARGASGKGDDVDVVWQLLRTDDGLLLKRNAARMAWIPEKVPLARVLDPYLAFETASASWPAGTYEVAELLDDLGVGVGVSGRRAIEALRQAKQGRRATVVNAAVKYRKSRESLRDARLVHSAGGVPGIVAISPEDEGPDSPADAPGRSPGVGGSRSGVSPGGPNRPDWTVPPERPLDDLASGTL